MAVLLSLAEHLLNFKDVEILSSDMSELKSKNIIVLDIIPKTQTFVPYVVGFAQDTIMPLRSPDYGEPMIGMELKSCSDIALNALGVRNTM